MGIGVMGCSWLTGKAGEMAVVWVMVGASFFTKSSSTSSGRGETGRFRESCMGGWAPCTPRGIWACIYGGDGSCRTSRGKCQGIGNWEIAVGSEVLAGAGTTGLRGKVQRESNCRRIQERWANWHGLSVVAKGLAWFGGGITLALETQALARFSPPPSLSSSWGRK